MRRQQLDELLREVGRIAGTRDVVVIGSQAVHAVTDAAPAEVIVSLECDVLFEESEVIAETVRKNLGPASSFHAARGIFVDAVAPGIPLLPEGWRERLLSLDAGGVVARCLEQHDLAVSKLAAGRLKDYEFVAALVGRQLVEVAVVRERIGTVADPRMRAILLARLQIVLESLGMGPPSA